MLCLPLKGDAQSSALNLMVCSFSVFRKWRKATATKLVSNVHSSRSVMMARARLDPNKKEANRAIFWIGLGLFLVNEVNDPTIFFPVFCRAAASNLLPHHNWGPALSHHAKLVHDNVKSAYRMSQKAVSRCSVSWSYSSAKFVSHQSKTSEWTIVPWCFWPNPIIERQVFYNVNMSGFVRLSICSSGDSQWHCGGISICTRSGICCRNGLLVGPKWQLPPCPIINASLQEVPSVLGGDYNHNLSALWIILSGWRFAFGTDISPSLWPTSKGINELCWYSDRFIQTCEWTRHLRVLSKLRAIVVHTIRVFHEC